jgi:hypothetical protein
MGGGLMGSLLVQVCPVGLAYGGEERWGRIWYRSALEALYMGGRIEWGRIWYRSAL